MQGKRPLRKAMVKLSLLGPAQVKNIPIKPNALHKERVKPESCQWSVHSSSDLVQEQKPVMDVCKEAEKEG